MTASKIKYRDKTGTAVVARSYCALLDILGLRAMVSAASSSGTLQALLKRFLAGTSAPITDIIETSDYVGQWYVHVFSDSLLFGYPIVYDTESAFGSLQDELSRYQYMLATEGFFTRGALCIGDLYI